MTWARRKLGDVCRPVQRRGPQAHGEEACFFVDISAIDREHNDIASPTRLTGETTRRLAHTQIRKGDVLVARERPHLGIVAQVPAHLDGHLASARLSVLRPDQDVILPRYLFYFCQSDDFVHGLAARARGGLRAAVSEEDIRSVDVLLPPLAEQHRLAAMLDQAWALRKLRTQASTRAGRVLPALLTRMFGSPARWGAHSAACPLGELVDVVRGARPPRATAYWDGRIPWAAPGDMVEDFVADTAQQVTEDAVRDTPLTWVEPGSVLLITRGGFLVRGVPVGLADIRLTIDRDVAALVPTRGEISGAYLLAVLKSVRPLLRALARGTKDSTHALDMTALLRIPVVVPDGAQRRACEAAVQSLRGTAERMRRTRQKLDDMCTVLLHRACSGALTARWREANEDELLREME